MSRTERLRGVVKILFRITAGFLFAWIIRDAVKAFCGVREGPSEKSSDNDEGYVPYEAVDSVCDLRRQLSMIEDLISDTESSVKLRISDAAKEYHLEVGNGEDFLKYLHSERDRLRQEITDIFHSF